jgi:hypothetical protein
MAEILAPIDQFIDDKNCSDIVILADKTICQFSLLNLSDLAKALRFFFFAQTVTRSKSSATRHHGASMFPDGFG